MSLKDEIRDMRMDPPAGYGAFDEEALYERTEDTEEEILSDYSEELEELIKERKCTVGCSDPKCDCGGYRRDGLPI